MESVGEMAKIAAEFHTSRTSPSAKRLQTIYAAYTGARISEITSLWPTGIEQVGQYRAFIINLL